MNKLLSKHVLQDRKGVSLMERPNLYSFFFCPLLRVSNSIRRSRTRPVVMRQVQSFRAFHPIQPGVPEPGPSLDRAWTQPGPSLDPAPSSTRQSPDFPGSSLRARRASPSKATEELARSHNFTSSRLVASCTSCLLQWRTRSLVIYIHNLSLHMREKEERRRNSSCCSTLLLERGERNEMRKVKPRGFFLFDTDFRHSSFGSIERLCRSDGVEREQRSFVFSTKEKSWEDNV